MAKLGGEYRVEGPRDRTVQEARNIFLGKIEKVEAEAEEVRVLQYLREQVLPAFERAVEETRPPPETIPPATPLGAPVIRKREPPWLLRRWEELKDPPTGPPLQDLSKKIEKWGRRWHLTDPWLLDTALATLIAWWRVAEERETRAGAVAEAERRAEEKEAEGEAREAAGHRRLAREGREYGADILARFHRLELVDLAGWQDLGDLLARYQLGGLNPDLPTEPLEGYLNTAPPFCFDHPPWIPTWHTWEAYHKELQNRLEKALHEYRDNRRQLFEKLREHTNLVREGTEKRARSSEDPYLHFEWVVRWQVQEWKHKEIADHYRKNPKTVGDAVRDVRRLINPPDP